MLRPSREYVNMQIAQIISTRGTCQRLKVGAVITTEDKIVSTGYNGPMKDQPHCEEGNCNTDEPCNRAVHAEINALEHLTYIQHFNLTGGKSIIYCTHQPCINCARAIERSGIKTVYFMNAYRDDAGLKYLIENGVTIYSIDKDGNSQQI